MTIRAETVEVPFEGNFSNIKRGLDGIKKQTEAIGSALQKNLNMQRSLQSGGAVGTGGRGSGIGTAVGAGILGGIGAQIGSIGNAGAIGSQIDDNIKDMVKEIVNMPWKRQIPRMITGFKRIVPTEGLNRVLKRIGQEPQIRISQTRAASQASGQLRDIGFNLLGFSFTLREIGRYFLRYVTFPLVAAVSISLKMVLSAKEYAKTWRDVKTAVGGAVTTFGHLLAQTIGLDKILKSIVKGADTFTNKIKGMGKREGLTILGAGGALASIAPALFGLATLSSISTQIFTTIATIQKIISTGALSISGIVISLTVIVSLMVIAVSLSFKWIQNAKGAEGFFGKLVVRLKEVFEFLSKITGFFYNIRENLSGIITLFAEIGLQGGKVLGQILGKMIVNGVVVAMYSLSNIVFEVLKKIGSFILGLFAGIFTALAGLMAGLAAEITKGILSIFPGTEDLIKRVDENLAKIKIRKFNLEIPGAFVPPGPTGGPSTSLSTAAMKGSSEASSIIAKTTNMQVKLLDSIDKSAKQQVKLQEQLIGHFEANDPAYVEPEVEL